MDVDAAEQGQVVERFLAALTSGDVQGLMDVLAPDVVVVADGGGLVTATRRPVEGAVKVARFLSAFQRVAPSAVVDTIWLNGSLGVRIVLDGALDTVVSFVVRAGRITRVYAVRNPHKLARLDDPAPVGR
jgi:RNA polymerase sigma-70 factor (ECF subfamily)